MSEGLSEVEIRLTRARRRRTRFEFDHSATVPEEQWGQFGPGAVGVGWDGGLLGLSLHLRADRSATAWRGSCRTRAERS
jgi:hypothetical protein